MTAQTMGLLTRIQLDYPVQSRPRYGWGRPDHPGLSKVLAAGRDRYRAHLEELVSHADQLSSISVDGDPERPDPSWVNGFLPGLDAAALYGMLAELRPRRYLEVGSGNSTKFARRAVVDNRLATEITSIDPDPRAAVDRLCDLVIRRPLEDVDPSIVDQLEPNDILFVDGSHRIFMNSDVVVLFLELLPRLRTGVYVQVHDVWLPSDYPPGWVDRFYSEQYLIASELLAGAARFEVELPAWFVSNDDGLARVLNPLWQLPHMGRVERHGCSFWMRVRQGA